MIRCYLLLLLLSIAPAPGAQVPDAVTREINALPEAPLNYLLDEGDLFGRHPHQFEMIAERLVAFVSAHDLPVYVVVYAGLMDSNLIRRANFLFDKWIGPEGDGVVLVYNSDTMEYQLVLPQKGLASFRDGQGSPARLLEFQLSPIDRELEVTLDGVEDRIDYLNRTTEILCQRLDEILSQEPSRIVDRSSMNLVAVVLGIGVVLTLLGVFANRRLRRAEERIRERFYFPDVTVGARLGAPFCGGRYSVVDFSDATPPGHS